MADVDHNLQQYLPMAQIPRRNQRARPREHVDRVASIFERTVASKLTQRTLLDLPHALSAHAEDGSDLLRGVLTFVSDFESAVACGAQAMLTVAAMLQMVPAKGVLADRCPLAMVAFVDEGETPP